LPGERTIGASGNSAERSRSFAGWRLPFTADFSAWYASTSILALLSVVAIAAWGWYHSMGNETLWRGEVE